MPKEYRIDYRDTGAFSQMVIDYIDAHPDLQPFYQWPVSMEGIAGAMEARGQFNTNRSLLVQVLQAQYGNSANELQKEQIEKLADPHTYTVCTAHQPNLFTGHLYFVYKILHAIRLCRELKTQFPDKHFVPVYYIGSEDADLDELGQVHAGGRDYRWQTEQTGAVGRMRVDAGLLGLIKELSGQLSVLPFGRLWIDLLEQCYRPGNSIADATFQLVNELFGSYGLLVLQPDHALLKSSFAPVMQRELLEQFSAPAVKSVVSSLAEKYHVQATGRELNLFYLEEGLRERIEKIQDSPARWKRVQTEKEWNEADLLSELRDFPERFSPNVILRPVYQEWILPNIAFIGGGGELAYWLELKAVFAAAGVPYPVLVLRNSFLLASGRQAQLLHKMGFEWKDIFAAENQLMEQFVRKSSTLRLSLEAEKKQLDEVYTAMRQAAVAVDTSLDKHVNALYQKALKKAEALEKKILRAEKRKFTDGQSQLHTLKAGLFPKGNLQERVENIMSWYARNGRQVLDELQQHSGSLEQQFTILELD